MSLYTRTNTIGYSTIVIPKEHIPTIFDCNILEKYEDILDEERLELQVCSKLKNKKKIKEVEKRIKFSEDGILDSKRLIKNGDRLYTEILNLCGTRNGLNEIEFIESKIKRTIMRGDYIKMFCRNSRIDEIRYQFHITDEGKEYLELYLISGFLGRYGIKKMRIATHRIILYV